MKIADHSKFHAKWENLQHKIGAILAMAHCDPWVSVDSQYEIAIQDAKKALELLRCKKLDKE